MTKSQTIIEMLKRYNEAQETLRRGSGNGNNVPAMPQTWNDSYVKLEQLLRRMRDERPSQYWHVRHRYIDPAEVWLTLPIVKRRHALTGKTIREPRPPAHCEVVVAIVKSGETTAKARCRQWDSRVRQTKADAGVHWLTTHFRGDAYLPEEFRADKAAA